MARPPTMLFAQIARLVIPLLQDFREGDLIRMQAQPPGRAARRQGIQVLSRKI